MADQEFEEFRDGLDDLPQHFTTPVQTYKLVHAITPMEENKSFLEKVQMGEKMWSDLHNDGSESLFTSWSSETTPTGSKIGSLFVDHNQGCATLTEGDDSGFCRSITSMTSSASSLVMTKSTPRFPSKDKSSSNTPPSGVWSSSSDSEEDIDIFDGRKKKNASKSVISNDPIRWDEDSKKKRDKKQNMPRQKLLPSFTKCGSIEVVDNLPPPPILRLGSYNNNKHRNNKSIASSDKISCSNGANNLSKRKRKQNTPEAMASHAVLKNVNASKSRDKSKTTNSKAKNEGDKPAMLLGRSSETLASQQKQHPHSKNSSTKSSNSESKGRPKKAHKEYPDIQSPEISLLQELKDATNNSAAIITAAQDLSAMTLSATSISDHPSLPSAFCLLSSCEKHMQSSFHNDLRDASGNDIKSDEFINFDDMDLCMNNFSKETHDLDIEEDEDQDTRASCGGHSSNGIVDVDSGNSSSHSPSPDDTFHSINTQKCQNKRPSNGHSHCLNGSESGLQRPTSLTSGINQTSSPCTPPPSNYLCPEELDLLDPTHRGLHKFIPRHNDEIEIDIGDPIYVQKEDDDLWCEGANLRTGCQGIFPLAHVVDIEYNEFDPSNHGGSLNAGGIKGGDGRKERYLLNYLGSIESSLYKGNVVLCQAVRKIVTSKFKPKPHPTVLEISDKGIKIVDKTKIIVSTTPCHDYFYSLKNVTFCGFHPRQPKYFGFVTKHPTLPKYACHVFVGDRSTQHVAEGCGRAFQRFYQKFIETAFPVEDIYLE